MCLILFAYNSHTDYSLVLAANRDEFFKRPSRVAGFWDDAPGVLGGRDELALGTWIGITRQGRFAALTNLRQGQPQAAPRSRGDLTRRFLTSYQSADEFLQQVEVDKQLYGGFNLLVGHLNPTQPTHLGYFNQMDSTPATLSAGVYGLSNGYLDAPWPKVTAGKQALSQALVEGAPVEQLFDLLADRNIAADEQLPDTGISLERERMLSARFIHSADYGTRASTVIRIDRQGQCEFFERNFGATGELIDQRDFRFQIEG